MSIESNGPAHGIVNKTVHKTVPFDGGMGGSLCGRAGVVGNKNTCVRVDWSTSTIVHSIDRLPILCLLYYQGWLDNRFNQKSHDIRGISNNTHTHIS